MKKITLKAARVNTGLNQKEAAAELGISEGTLVNYEKGTSFPDVSMIEKIKRLYGLEYDEIQWRVE